VGAIVGLPIKPQVVARSHWSKSVVQDQHLPADFTISNSTRVFEAETCAEVRKGDHRACQIRKDFAKSWGLAHGVREAQRMRLAPSNSVRQESHTIDRVQAVIQSLYGHFGRHVGCPRWSSSGDTHELCFHAQESDRYTIIQFLAFQHAQDNIELLREPPSCRAFAVLKGDRNVNSSLVCNANYQSMTVVLLGLPPIEKARTRALLF